MLRNRRPRDPREFFQARSIRIPLMADWTARLQLRTHSTSQTEHTNETRKDTQLDWLPRTRMEGGPVAGRRQFSDELRSGLGLERIVGLGAGYVEGLQATVEKGQ